MKIKPFADVKPGDNGQDYGDSKGTVIKTGTLDELRHYDSTGACDDVEYLPDTSQMVAIEDEDGDTFLYCYGADGFSVNEGELNETL